ncbi:MAG: hypothetical protein JXN60_09435 [Lentisphaerae bacterium]|nr:hypothetical protein [Lentisphaerota bacterium]
MTRYVNRYSRGIVGLPSVFVAVGWLAIWLVWPTDAARHTVRRTETGTKIRYTSVAGDPYGDSYTRFAGAMLPPQNEDDDTLLLSYERQREPAFMGGDIELISDSAVAPYLPDSNFSGRSSFLQWSAEKVFSAKKHGALRIKYALKGGLAECNFDIPKDVLNSFAALSDNEWEIVVCVEVDEKGRVEHVFVEEQSGDKNIDISIVRALYGGKAMAGSSECSGKIYISAVR